MKSGENSPAHPSGEEGASPAASFIVAGVDVTRGRRGSRADMIPNAEQEARVGRMGFRQMALGRLGIHTQAVRRVHLVHTTVTHTHTHTRLGRLNATCRDYSGFRTECGGHLHNWRPVQTS